MANRKLSCAMLYRWFKCKLKPPKKQNRSILIKLTYWEGTHTQGASQSAGTANWTPGTVAKTVPRSLQMQQMLQVDLLLRPINLIGLVPTWHGAPSQVDHTLNRST